MKAPAVLLLLFLVTPGFAQVKGKVFPDMEVETIEDEMITIPEFTNGKYTLVGLAFAKKSEDDLNTWFSPIYNKFIRESSGLFSSFSYDVNVYFIPMFTGINAAAKGTAKKQAVKKVDPLLHPNILFYKGKLKPYKEALEFEKRDTPYFFILDKEGKIIYETTGPYSSKKMVEIEEVLD